MQDQIQRVKAFLLSWQNDLCSMLEQHSEQSFFHDDWQRPEGGGGQSRVMHGDVVFESAGVNFSHIDGAKLPKASSHDKQLLADCPYQALGVSTVIHPHNPYVPTSHANLRLFVAEGKEGPVWWFGGGFDLTPYYGFKEDCVLWQQQAKAACDPYGVDVYQKYKAWCDSYFYLQHRQEPRGIGGLFFDDVNHWDFDTCFDFLKDVGQAYLTAYNEIIGRRKGHSFSDKERAFQGLRRGRYVEFNLLYDRGTLFGLQSNGRTESILMSLPPTVNWQYGFVPQPGSAEANLIEEFLTPKDWLKEVLVTS